jgi:hypothetical protein
MVYLARKNGAVIFHTDLAAMQRLDGVSTAEKTITDAEWDEAGGLARIIDGEIVVGLTAAEQAAQEKEEQIAEIKAKLAEIDRLDGPRPIREAVRDMAESAGLNTSFLMKHEDEAVALRGQLAGIMVQYI